MQDNNAFEQAALSSVTYRKNVTDEEFSEIQFADLDELDEVFEKEEIILEFKGKRTGKSTFIMVEHLTPGEVASIENSLLSQRVLRAITSAIPGSDDEIQAAAEYDKQAEEIQRDKMVKVIQRGFRLPKGVTEERIRKWEPMRLWDVYQTIVKESTAVTAVDEFHKLDNTTTEQATSCDNQEHSEG